MTFARSVLSGQADSLEQRLRIEPRSFSALLGHWGPVLRVLAHRLPGYVLWADLYHLQRGRLLHSRALPIAVDHQGQPGGAF